MLFHDTILVWPKEINKPSNTTKQPIYHLDQFLAVVVYIQLLTMYATRFISRRDMDSSNYSCFYLFF